ncbi:hypothetical protein QG37_07713 [Candidozyma auris]|uniref:Uncharacterized protein n=1 Tax=Candidozyma auris TaxID=498019 RepID=A0A0L0NPC4_CANAR|nr:hypothetical protein QG37_07713 [[Candida] auris]
MVFLRSGINEYAEFSERRLSKTIFCLFDFFKKELKIQKLVLYLF